MKRPPRAACLTLALLSGALLSGCAGPLSEPSGEAADEPVAVAPANGRREAAEQISFDDLVIGMQPDTRFREFMLSERAKELDGQRVAITGFMLADTQVSGIKEFVLLRNTECKFGPGGLADHLVSVTLREGESTHYRSRPVRLEGTLKIDPYHGPGGFTWYIYELNEADNVTTVRR